MTAQPSGPLAGDPVPAGDPVSPDGIAVPRGRPPRRIKAEHIRDYGIVVFALVATSLGLLAWGIVAESRDRTRLEQGREVYGDRAARAVVGERSEPVGQQ